MKQGIYLLIYIFFAVMISCSPVSHLTVDLADPSKGELPPKIQSLTLVNRAVDRRFTDDPEDTVQLYFYKRQFNLDSVIYDTKAADTLMQALGKLLFESGRYDIVIPEERFLMKDTLNTYADTMKWDEVRKITDQFSTDAVLSLDYFKTSVSARLRAVNYEKGNSLENENNSYHKLYMAGMDISYGAQFRVYYPADSTKFNNLFLTDTLSWNENDIDLRNLFGRLTSIKKALIETGISAALNLNHQIAPSWKSYERNYFSRGDELLLQTREKVMKNDWEEARNQWMNLYDKAKSKSLRSKLEFNIALSYEMQGNLDEAIRWGVQSYKTYYRSVTYNYLEVLKSRKLLLEKTNENNE